MNKKNIAIVLLALCAAFPAHALDGRIVRQLKALAPEERREQRCDIEAMARIASEKEGFKPDKVIAYTFSDPEENGDWIKAPGAAFRSAGDWYRLKFKCETSEHGLAVESFQYKIGSKVPRNEWEEHYLYD